MSEYGKPKLLEFLDYLGNKGMMNKSTTQSRKAAVNTFLGVLEPHEVEDVRKLNLDEVTVRFQNLKGTEFKPDSIKVYKSRVQSAIDDFKRWKADPSNFKVTFAPKPSAPQKQRDNAATASKTHTHSPGEEILTGVVFPIPIRAGVIVKIAGLPGDLSKSEATKIANVVQALATAGDEG